VRLAQACPILAYGARLEVRLVADRLSYEMTLRSGRETLLPLHLNGITKRSNLC
jgi:hypothetical protein